MHLASTEGTNPPPDGLWRSVRCGHARYEPGSSIRTGRQCHRGGSSAAGGGRPIARTSLCALSELRTILTLQAGSPAVLSITLLVRRNAFRRSALSAPPTEALLSQR